MIELKNEPLHKYTSLKTGGPARTLIKLEPGDELKNIVLDSLDRGMVWVLGYGTNSLVSDEGLPGTVILDRSDRIELLDETTIKAESGVNWDDFVQFAVENNLWGIEFASGIPGGMGAAIVGNIAAYGHKVSDTFVEATILDPADRTIKIWKNEDLGFTYRSSTLKSEASQHLIILDTTFRFSKNPRNELEYRSAQAVAEDMGLLPDSLKNRRKIIMETRKRAGSLLSTSQTGPWTAGSFFKNPLVDSSQLDNIIAYEEHGVSNQQIRLQNQLHSGDKTRVSAAHVLLAAGFRRGQTWGNVRLHKDHVLKIENIGEASAQEIHDVVHHILQTVKEKLDIDLEPEVQFIGNFTS